MRVFPTASTPVGRRRVTTRGRRRGRTAAIATVVAVGLSVGLATPAMAGPAPTSSAGPSHPAASSPWSTADYRPTPGDWSPYVLAPSGHTVDPTSVLFAQSRGGSITGTPQAAIAGRGSVTLTSGSAGTAATSPLLALDFGKEVGGEVKVHVTSSTATAPTLHVCFSESKAEMALTPTQNNGEAAYAPGCDTANIFNGFGSAPYTYDSDSHTLAFDTGKLPATVQDAQIRGGFRYVTFFVTGPGAVTFDKVSLDYLASPNEKNPADYKGWFLSSDNELNKIWYAGAYTVQMDTWLSDTAKSWPYADGEPDSADAQIPYADPSQEVILDGAKRDRVVWQGDLAVEAPVTYLSTGDTAAVDNSLTSLAKQQLPDGYVPAESLVGPHNTGEERTYGEYVTWFVNNMYDHWLYTGDRSYLSANWTGLQEAMTWLGQQRDSTGLISFAASGSCGHYGYTDCGHETYVNSLYVQNLHQMATLAGAMHSSSAMAAAYGSQATAVSSAINAQLWDPSTGAYRLSTETPTVYPQDANATAVLTGVASGAQATRALAYLKAKNWSTDGSLSVSPSTPGGPQAPNYEPLPSGFEATARLDSATTASQDLGEQLIKTYWGGQLAQDPGSTFWEKAATDGTPGLGDFTSLAHGWASTPTVALTQQVLGVTPTSGGYATFSVAPRPGTVSWSEGSVPTPHGSIAASWRKSASQFALTVSVPRSTSATLAVPSSASATVTLDGHVVWAHGRSVGHSGAAFASGSVSVAGVGAGTHRLVSATRR
ncbi:hypothetical protein AX769_13575 [Frondihabitans sp. PAMC 28766]|uniref:alpha-L-rhamnosidase-related protein n=1 Tax=Frondihabitans sp. PAMC 28766 TaxID=1795630 RepID=UPI00078D502B|nr:alpha-L-rhamnosidase C-terminal domain-containing protein [Frondihabitans sp. PAMC 28766]AMM20975.1 hypothetical protein AX769_13575 [Frondihabitans sp. PAMC 28766]